ncbi:MAG TPA: sigma 54-interacting transcriptional regulator [Silvibacterium sp.]|nr:sigma 54-interacting transcriptional regulator [Silvibacterium sp.]
MAACAMVAPYTTDEPRLFQSICDQLVGAGACRLAWFGYATRDTQRIAPPVAWSGNDEFVRELKLALVRDDYEDPATIAIRDGAPCWIKQLQGHTGMEATQVAVARFGYTSVVSVPLMPNDSAYGALTLYYDDPEALEQAAVSLLKGDLGTIWAAFASGPPAHPTASEELDTELRNLINVIPHHVALQDAGGMLLELNQAMIDYSGYSLEDFNLRGAYRHVWHPDDNENDRIARLYAEGRASGTPFAYEARNRRKDGQYRWHLVHVTPIRNEEGKVIRWCSVGTDIEELKRAEEKLRQSEREARQILNLSPLHITELGPDGERRYNNQAALDYFGLTLEEWQTADLQRVIHPQDIERMTSEMSVRFRIGALFEFELRLRRNDGQYRWFHYRFSPMLDEQGAVTRWYLAGTDIEDRKLAEQQLQHENISLREEIDRASLFEEIVGISRPLKNVVTRISKVAPTDSTVLITGETGTGKELAARAIHRRSRRSARSFVSVNCAAIPRDLIASELFGHEKGAFTGATQRRLGRFELAAQGTIFLDEVGELPPETQVALLRVLQEREFERVGGSGLIQTDVRVIAATNRDLEAEIAAGRFRSDLFYRLNVFPIEMPPLRKREEDIPLLVEYFLDRYARKAGKTFDSLSNRSLQLLQSYPWPGNIRELQNVIERSVIVNETRTFSVDESWLSRQPQKVESSTRQLSATVAAQEKEMIEAALRESVGRVSGPTGAAKKLGMPGSTLESKIKALKIDKNRFRFRVSE